MQKFPAREIPISTEEMEKIALILVRVKIREGLINGYDVFGYATHQPEKAKTVKALAYQRQQVTDRKIKIPTNIIGEVAITSEKTGVPFIKLKYFAEALLRERIDEIFS